MEAKKDVKALEPDLEFLKSMELMEKMEMLQLMDEFGLDSPSSKKPAAAKEKGDKK